MKTTHFSHQIVEFIPERLDDCVLYVSHRFKTAVHRCACGCGEEVVTPLGPVDWSIRIHNGTATLDPSIGNWSFVCRSHYFIWDGRVVWSYQMSRRQIEHGRALDAELREEHIENTNRESTVTPRHLWRKGWAVLRRWWLS